VLTSRRGGGTRVADTARPLPEAARLARVRELAATYLAHARALGASDPEIRAALDGRLE
jgi:DNA-binding transcriptional regulator YhcF (GntR family)